MAALALLPPLQSRLTDQAASDLENATSADVPLFEREITASLRRARGAQPRAARRSQLSVDMQNRALLCASAPTHA